MNYPSSNPYTGSPLIGEPASPPSVSGMGMLGSLLPMLTGGMPPGMAMGPMFGTQHYLDMQRAMAYSRDVQLANVTASQIANEQFTRFATGAAQLANNGVPLTAAERAHIQNAVSGFGPAMGYMAPMLEGYLPGTMQFMDAVGLGAHAATGQLLNTGRSRVDIATGRSIGPAAVQQYLDVFQQQFYGPDAVSPDGMQGYGMAQLSRFIDVGHRAGILSHTGLSRDSVERLRAGENVNAVLSDTERRAIGPEGVATLAHAGGNSERVDEALRRVDAMKLAKYGENMAGLFRAMEDLFGSGQSVEQAVTLANRLTQGGLSRMSLSQIENVMRRMDSMQSITGIAATEMANLDVTAANFAERSGGSREQAVGAGMYAAAMSHALQGRFAGTGMTSSEYQQRMAALTGSAAASRVGQQFNTVMRIGSLYKFREGSEAEAIHRAIQSGQDTYEWGGTTRSAYMRNESEWQSIMAAGADGLSAADVSRMRSATASNAMYGTEQSNIAAQRSQYGTDIEPWLGSIVGTATGRRNDAALTQAVWGTVSNFVTDSELGQAGNTNKMIDELAATLAAQGVPDARNAAIRIVESGDRMAQTMGQSTLMQMGLLHGGSGRHTAELSMAKGDARARAMAATSGIGRTGLMARIVEAIASAADNPAMSNMDIVAAAGGLVSLDDITGAFDTAEAQIMADPKYTDQQRKLVLQELQEERKKATAYQQQEMEQRAAMVDEAREQAAAAAEEAAPPAVADEAERVAEASDRLAGTPQQIHITGDLILRDNNTVGLVGTAGAEGYSPVAAK